VPSLLDVVNGRAGSVPLGIAGAAGTIRERRLPDFTEPAIPDFAEFIIEPAEGRTRWLNPNYEKSFNAPVIWLRGPALPQKIFWFFRGQITGLLCPSRSKRGDVGRRHGRWSGLRWTRECRETSDTDACGEVVWS
jgi:hypothetical protein